MLEQPARTLTATTKTQMNFMLNSEKRDGYKGIG
jgi:hypothetical protein